MNSCRMLRNAQIVRKIWLFSSWYTVAPNRIIHTQNDMANKQANQVSFLPRISESSPQVTRIPKPKSASIPQIQYSESLGASNHQKRIV